MKVSIVLVALVVLGGCVREVARPLPVPPLPRYLDAGEPAPLHTPPIVSDAGVLTVTDPGF